MRTDALVGMFGRFRNRCLLGPGGRVTFRLGLLPLLAAFGLTSCVSVFQPHPGTIRAFDLGSGITLDLVWIPPGEFIMGSSPEEYGHDEKQHRVKLTRGFWMGKYEVTQEQWQKVMEEKPSRCKGLRLPMDDARWIECQEFIIKLNTKFDSGHWKQRKELFRLPTEAEWEYACRAGTTTCFHSGDKEADLDRVAWYGRNSGDKIHAVGEKQANAWGLHDMHGNAEEWCQDWYGEYPSGTVTNPMGPSAGEARVVRSVGLGLVESWCRSAIRGWAEDSDCTGFRIVLAVDDEDSDVYRIPAGKRAGQAALAKMLASATPLDPGRNAPWTNSLGMKFAQIPGVDCRFSVWETRVLDFEAFAQATAFVQATWHNIPKRPMSQSGEETYPCYETWTHPGFKQTPNDPVCYVNWKEAKAFCSWLTETERKAGVLPAGWKYRLPTDIEWSVAVGLGKEKGMTPASKAGKIQNVYPWGRHWPPMPADGNYSVVQDGFEQTAPVGSFKANKYGLYDMGGNVAEWCEDEYYPKGGQVLRGAAWNNNGTYLWDFLSSIRRPGHYTYRQNSIGFRCVLVSFPVAK